MDIYQERYTAHQHRKRDVLIQLMEERHSDRMFDDRPVSPEHIQVLVESARHCPSSCDRQAVAPVLVTERDAKALLGGLLVGGVGWVHRAPAVIMLWADPAAYKAGDERRFMPFIDTGAIVHQFYLMSAALGLHGCYVNPAVRKHNREHFMDTFSPTYGPEPDSLSKVGIYGGAMAVGYPRVVT